MKNNQLPLNQLPIGKTGRVVSLVSDGTVRRRILDLGIISGTKIEPLYKSPSGNPIAYLIRGTVIALRSDISSKIMVEENGITQEANEDLCEEISSVSPS